MRRFVLLAALAASTALAQSAPSASDARNSGYQNSARATVVHPANVYVSPDDSSDRTDVIQPGREIVVLEISGPWVRVYANTDVEPSAEDTPVLQQDQPVPVHPGWIHNHGIVDAHSPDGDLILFGAAATLEQQASAPHPPVTAANSAHLLYRRVFDYFPASTLAPESLWRSADIRWQLEKSDVATLPSAHERQSYLRPRLYEGDLKLILKKWPGSKWAALAAFDLIDENLCGDWQGLPSCPEKESTLYAKYAAQYPNGPKTAEALYNTAVRLAALVDMYTDNRSRYHADDAVKGLHAIARQLQHDFPGSDFAARAAALAFRCDQGIPNYGNDRD